MKIRIAVCFVCLLLSACSDRTELPDTVQDVVFNTIEGEQIALAPGNGPVLVYFWSTSCVICVHEMPDLATLYEANKERGLKLVAVAMPYDAPNTVVELAQKQALPFPVALDIQGKALESFVDVKGTPTSYLIDSEGKLVRRYVGAIEMNELQKQLDLLLKTT